MAIIKPKQAVASATGKQKGRASAASIAESLAKVLTAADYSEALVKTDAYPGSAPDYANAEGEHVSIVAEFDVRRVNDLVEIAQNKDIPVTFIFAATEKTMDPAGKKSVDGAYLNLLAQDLQRLIPGLGFERVVAVYKDALWIPQPYAKVDRTLLEPRIKWTKTDEHPLAKVLVQREEEAAQ